VRYQSSGAFRRVLEQRLRTHNLQTGVPLVRLRKMIAFDRFLARLLRDQPEGWVVKGGLALQLRLGTRARTTKDMDVLTLLKTEEITQALRKAGSIDLGDWFAFEVADPTQDLTIEHGGIRHTIQTSLDGRPFEQFHIDVGVGDPLVDTVEFLNTPPLLNFADLSSTRVPCYPITQQIAEKFHAYTRPHKSGESSRVKDYVDILLMAGLGAISGAHLLQAIQATFTAMATHGVPRSVPPPPPNWETELRRMSKEVGINLSSLEQSYEFIQSFLNPILRGEYPEKWDPTGKTWY